MMKVGRSAARRRTRRSRTPPPSPATTRVTEAVLDEFGVVRARTTEEMLDIAYAAHEAHLPGAQHAGRADRLGRRRRADLRRGGGRRAADAADAGGRRRRGCGRWCPSARPRNPVDCTAQVTNDLALIGDLRRERGGGRRLRQPSSPSGRRRRPAAPSAPQAARGAEGGADRHPGPALGAVHARAARTVREYEADGWLVLRGPLPRGGRDRRDGPLRRGLRQAEAGRRPVAAAAR